MISRTIYLPIDSRQQKRFSLSRIERYSINNFVRLMPCLIFTGLSRAPTLLMPLLPPRRRHAVGKTTPVCLQEDEMRDRQEAMMKAALPPLLLFITHEHDMPRCFSA